MVLMIKCERIIGRVERKSKQLSKISYLHYFKLVLRSLLFVVVLVFYILDGTEFVSLPILAMLLASVLWMS